MPRTEVIKSLAQYYDEGDLGFIEMINNLSYSYKVQLKQQRSTNLTHSTNATRLKE